MARHLIEYSDGLDSDDAKYALSFLRDEIRRSPRHHSSAHFEKILADYQYPTAIESFYDEWKTIRGRSGDMSVSKFTFYFMKHGTRRDWELLHAVYSQEVIGRGTSELGGVLISLAVSDTIKKMYMIPILALAVQDRRTVESYRVSVAERAIADFQTLTGKDFGFKSTGTAEEKRAAIDRAEKWWKDEGKSKFTFAFIEKEIAAKKPMAETPVPKRP